MATEAALVHDGELHLPSKSTPIKIGSDEWRFWLKDAKKFRFSHSQGREIQPGSGIISFRDLTFTAFRAGKDKPYWNAQRRKQGVLSTRYLGRDEDLTYETMVEIALMLDKGSTKDEGKQRSLKSTRSESHSDDNYATTQTLISQLPNSVTRWNVYERAKSWDSKQKAYAWSEWQWCGSWETEAKADSQIETRKEHNHRKNSMSDYGVLPMEWEKRFELIAPAMSLQQSHSDGDYATARETSLQPSDETAELKVRIAELENQEEELLNLQDENQRLQEENAKLKQKFEGLPEREQEMREEINRLMRLQLENDNLKTWNQELREALENNPSPEKLIQEYETDCETIKQTLPKLPKNLPRNKVEFERFKSWLSRRLGR